MWRLPGISFLLEHAPFQKTRTFQSWGYVYKSIESIDNKKNTARNKDDAFNNIPIPIIFTETGRGPVNRPTGRKDVFKNKKAVWRAAAGTRKWGGLFWFWSAMGTSKIEPDPSTVVVLLRREHDFQKIMFFYQKTWFLNLFGPSKINKYIVGGEHPCPWVFFRRRMPICHQDPQNANSRVRKHTSGLRKHYFWIPLELFGGTF